MRDYSIFDIIGPIMIGPSSSHTAGACRIAKMAKKIAGSDFNKVTFYLYGSFATTYKGHGSDRALLGGVMDMNPDDDNIKIAYELADERKLNYEFIPVTNANTHPNTIKLLFEFEDKDDVSVTGVSIGGGNIEIIEIDAIDVSFTGTYPMLIFKYPEQKGVIAYVSTIISNNDYNIESIKTLKRDNEITLLIEIGEKIKEDIIDEFMSNTRFDKVLHISAV